MIPARSLPLFVLCVLLLLPAFGAARAFGDTVVVHYFYWESWRDAKTGAVVQENDPRRITHTWQRRGESWQIITGMSATYEH